MKVVGSQSSHRLTQSRDGKIWGRSLCLSSISYVTELPLRFMKVRRRPETIFRVGLLDRQSEVRFCVSFVNPNPLKIQTVVFAWHYLFGIVRALAHSYNFTSTDGTVRFRRRKIFFAPFCFWFHGCSNLTQIFSVNAQSQGLRWR